MTDLLYTNSLEAVNALLPDSARRYLQHTARGRPIREIAREAGCHASTVLRQVRKLESQRDDPLLDRALSQMARPTDATEALDTVNEVLDAATDAMRRLGERGALLLYNADLPQPAIVKTLGEGETRLLGTVSLDIAASLILRNWITQEGGTTVKRYRVTAEGRACLPGLIAARDGRASRHMEETQSQFDIGSPDRRSRTRSNSNGPGSESPLIALSRRKGPDGQPFLPRDCVDAGIRLHEDYNVAGFRSGDLVGWTAPDSLQKHYASARLSTDRCRREAILRTLDAIKDLGPGLSDVVLRCCCLREGLESTEKRMGWSARSGKVVLRIALQRLCLFYDRTGSKDGILIG